MGKSYRIKAVPGKDTNIVVEVDQDFEQLEILSLKIRQDDVYLRMCSDYGVIAGRVFANNGYGIPNAKIAVFVPILPGDIENPIISTLYPYKNLEDTNEDGYKFNLLPYLPSYDNHVATGTFPTRKDALVNQTVVELYDKYYKFTVTTNDSGDYMIFGVPVGTQTLVMNLDVSDMGPFSLAPADLVRMGVATEEQFDGVKFKSSPNFNELPQIIVLNKTIEVSPFWGQPDICQIGITRTDFDITSEANIDIKPTAIFMGSLVSSSEKTAVDAEGVAKKETGNLCSLTTGPGEIIAITQTIYRDANGLPVLKRGEIPKGGKVIEGDGTWMFDLPMNMDYVYTNEFGEQALSDDPSKGIPTKGKYRFKIKWQQSNNTFEDYKRGYYLVPNIREKGWVSGGSDPLNGSSGPTAYLAAQRSYAFSLDWSAYTVNTPINITNPDISEIVNCEDTFYEFDYNKVYTVSELLDNNKHNSNKERFIGIKRIDDDTCSDTVNRYPVNDGVFHTTLIWRIFNILLVILGIVGLILLIIYSVIAFLWPWLKYVLYGLLLYWCGDHIASAVEGIIAAATPSVGFGATVWVAGIIYYGVMLLIWIALAVLITIAFLKLKDVDFKPIRLPMLTYPDCDACDCEGNNSSSSTGPSASNTQTSTSTPTSNFILPLNISSTYTKLISDFETFFPTSQWRFSDDYTVIQQQLAGVQSTGHTDTYLPLPAPVNESTLGWLPPTCGGGIFNDTVSAVIDTSDIPLGERINLFNTKSKYYNDEGAVNQISVQYDPTANPSTNHTDNVIAVICQPGTDNVFSAGSLFSFTNPALSNDPNFKSGATNSLGTRSISGTTNYPGTITIQYADPSNKANNLTKVYNVPTNIATDQKLYIYPSDIEYFQVITGMTVSSFRALTNNGALSSPITSFGGVVDSSTRIDKYYSAANGDDCHIWKDIKPIDLVDQNSIILIIQRGVDPYSPAYPTKFGLGKIFGSSITNPAYEVSGDYRLNIPIKSSTSAGNELMFRHNVIGGPSNTNATIDNGFNLFFPSYIFTPDATYYTGYTTTLHNYYSKLDYSVSASNTYLIETGNSNSNFTPYSSRGTWNSAQDVWTPVSNDFYSSSVTDGKYHTHESIVGGSFMYRDGAIRNYYSAIYSTGLTLSMSNSSKIVMRSDRLPSSDKFVPNLNNTLVLQQNNVIGAYVFADGGLVTVGGSLASPSYGGGSVTNTNNAFSNNVLNTFDCEHMVDLDCYHGDGLTFSVDPACEGNDTIEHGCYVFVRNPLIGLFEDQGYGTDIENFVEWIYRFRFFYALCQGVLSNVFNNNWINGNLYAFPFKINRYFDSNNQMLAPEYPGDVVVLHDETHNFYYRSSPYNSSGHFIGSTADGQDGANHVNLKTPTTIMNLGPREEFLKQITLNGNFDGYNMKNIYMTSYNDLSETINLFSIIRIIDHNFWNGLFGDQITRLFSRTGKKVDADFAQSAAINSQVGVIPFDSSFYSTSAAPGVIPSAIAAGVGGSNNTVMGIFFSSTTEHMQIRDYISPGRTIRYNTLTSSFVYDYNPIKSQKVPHYKWKINGGTTLFGSQVNEWATTTGDIQAIKYQEMDRLSSGYPVGVSSYDYNKRGYLFNSNGVTNLGNYVTTPDSNNPGLGGAPWYFYFGLLKGSTAINKFYSKYIGETTLNG